jgi:hypothetical protein
MATSYTPQTSKFLHLHCKLLWPRHLYWKQNYFIGILSYAEAHAFGDSSYNLNSIASEKLLTSNNNNYGLHF